MGRRYPKIKVSAYGKDFAFDARKICGYIKCDRLKTVFPISLDANPHFTDKKIESYLCLCGHYTDDDPFYHTVFNKGKEIKYGDW